MLILPDLIAIQSSPNENLTLIIFIPLQDSGSIPSVLGESFGLLSVMLIKRSVVLLTACTVLEGEF